MHLCKGLVGHALECVAQCGNKHHHMLCANMNHVPRDWLCRSCIEAGVMIIRHVLNKRIVRGRTEYQVGWVGREDEEPTWQALQDIPAGSRYLVNGHNARLRREAATAAAGGPGGGGGNISLHSYIGKEVATDFSHGAVYTGYVTAHYPAELDGNEMTEELFHVEYDDGDEEDLDEREVAAAIALAAGRRQQQ